MSRSATISDEESLLLETQLCFPLYAATNLLQRLYRPLLQPLDLTYTEYLVMLVLWEDSWVHVGQIHECLHLESGALRTLLQRMETKGLIARKRDPKEARRVLVGVTDHGRSLHQKALSVPREMLAYTGLATKELEDMRNQVGSLVARLAKNGM